MFHKDPLKRMESMVQSAHEGAGKYTRPVLDRYPLLFTFLLTFSVAATFHGFELFVQGIPIFEKHPMLLLALGIAGLFFTGSLYKGLQK